NTIDSRRAHAVPAPPPARTLPLAPPPARNGDNGVPRPASPATRRLARRLGVGLRGLPRTASGGRIPPEGVQTHLPPVTQGGRGPSAAAAPVVPPLPDFGKWGPIEKQPFTALRKAIARNLSLSWSLAPQVTQHDQADITELEDQRKKVVDSAPKGTPKI